MNSETGILKSALKQYFGYDEFRGEQEQIIQNLLDGKDTFVIMPTGGGKSLCYQLPALISQGTAIVVSPLIALMKNQVDAVRRHSEDNEVAHFINSSLSKTEIKRVKESLVSGKTKLLYVAPESLIKPELAEFLSTIHISFFAIDEAHCISEWGHDFRPEYRKLKSIFSQLANSPVIALTATATEKVQQDIQKNLGILGATLYKSSFNRTNLFYEVRPKQNVTKEIIKFIRRNTGKSGIVYCLSRKKVEEIAEVLQLNGINALPYHAGLDGATRMKNQDAFLYEKADVIVATIAFGMGIDKPDVRFVIHHDIPKSIESYYQETGRAGRDGGEGHCLSFYSYKDLEKLEKFLHGKPVSEVEIGKQLLMEVASYAETSVCRRKYILHYFGEKYNEEKCSEMCDNCKDPKEKFDGQDDLMIVLSAVGQMKNTQRIKHVVDVITGLKTSEVLEYGHNKLDSFAKGDKESRHHWNAVLRQCLVHGFLRKDIESYGVLHITEKGKEFVASPAEFFLFKERDYSDLDDTDDLTTDRSSKGMSIDQALFDLLMDERKRIADEEEVPPFVVFQEPSLQEMCARYPITQEELCNIVGVGKGKAARYGTSFVQLIKQYVEENNIERPEDIVIKSQVKKSVAKVQIIQFIDMKMSLEDIAKTKGYNVEELIGDLEAIVNSGTKVNINYYIDDVLDDDHQEEIYDYFYEADSDSIDEAYDEFDGDYTEEEIRLMRIKFLSEVAN